MKTLLALLLSVSLCAAADGYKYQTDYAGLADLPVKIGEVVKVRNFATEADTIVAPSMTVTMYYGRRHFSNEIKLTITANQWAHLQHSRTAYLRRGGERWELLGTDMYRDPNGQPKFRY